jgi:sulfite reductase (ferredoxin)
MHNGTFRDYRGVACPMNFARITMDLVDMQTGGILEVWLDSEEQAGKVSQSLMRDGQAVLEMVQEKDFWKISIRKDTDYQ